MKGSGHEGPVPQGNTFGIARDHAVHEGRQLAARKRLDGHACGLVERQQRGIFEDDPRADVGIRRDRVVIGFGEGGDLDRLAAAELEALRRTPTVHQHVAGLDGLANERACRTRIGQKQGGVQSNAALFVD